MPTYLHPGVYIEEIPSGVKTIEAVGTSTAAFIGYTTKGPVDEPRLIFNFDDYTRLYGGIRNLGNELLGDAMGFSVRAFFQNGGTKAYIVRLAADGASDSLSRPLASATGSITLPDALLDFEAVNAGSWANGLIVQIGPKFSGSSLYRVIVGRNNAQGKLQPLETFSDVSLDPDHPRFIDAAINGVSQNVKVTADTEAGAPTSLEVSSVELDGGEDGKPAEQGSFDDVFTAFVKIRDVNTICLPDHQWDDDGKPFLESAIAHAEATMSRMVIVDPPASEELVTEQDVTDLTLPTSTYTALYYPWVKVANPFFDEEDNPGVPATLLVPPSGYAAGMWSKIDGRRGVWKAPAGVETQLLGLAALEYVVENAEQDQLNPLGVNALRKINGFGHVIWGTRTLSTRANPEWRYVPVRRTAIFIEQSLYNGIQWAVFEPNDHRLWASLRANVDAFMNGLFRSGAFQGEKASDAYFVRCGLGDTMTQADIDRGQVIVIVGFAPLKPAEFVIVRIQQKVAQQ